MFINANQENDQKQGFLWSVIKLAWLVYSLMWIHSFEIACASNQRLKMTRPAAINKAKQNRSNIWADWSKVSSNWYVWRNLRPVCSDVLRFCIAVAAKMNPSKNSLYPCIKCTKGDLSKIFYATINHGKIYRRIITSMMFLPDCCLCHNLQNLLKTYLCILALTSCTALSTNFRLLASIWMPTLQP